MSDWVFPVFAKHCNHHVESLGKKGDPLLLSQIEFQEAGSMSDWMFLVSANASTILNHSERRCLAIVVTNREWENLSFT